MMYIDTKPNKSGLFSFFLTSRFDKMQILPIKDGFGHTTHAKKLKILQPSLVATRCHDKLGSHKKRSFYAQCALRLPFIHEVYYYIGTISLKTVKFRWKIQRILLRRDITSHGFMNIFQSRPVCEC